MSSSVLERLLVVVEHLIILIGHPGVQTLLLVTVDVAGSRERSEIGQIVEGLGASQEDQDFLEAAVRSGGGTHPIVEEGFACYFVIVWIGKRAYLRAPSRWLTSWAPGT